MPLVGMVVDLVVEDGNPADVTLAVKSISRLTSLFGTAPRQVSFDGAFASRLNLTEIKALGVEDVAFNKRCGLEGANFLFAAAREAAAWRVAHPEPKQTLNTDRLYADLLSSMPMCFNLFGPLWADLVLGASVLAIWWPGLPGTVSAVRFEWSPGRQVPGRYLEIAALSRSCSKRRSPTAVWRLSVSRRSITSTALPSAPRAKSASSATVRVCDASGVFRPGAVEAIIGTHLQQIWLDHLLALSLCALETLFTLDEDLEEAPVVGLRAASAGLGRAGIRCPPHELLAALRALRKLGLIRLEKAGPGRFRISADQGLERVRQRLRDLHQTSRALIDWCDLRLKGKTGRDLRVELDVGEFLDQERSLFEGVEAPAADGARSGSRRRSGRRGDARSGEAAVQGALFAVADVARAKGPERGGERGLYERYRRDEIVEAAVALHHFEAWHLSDPPVLFDIALKVRFDPHRTIESLDLGRPSRQRKHEISLVHLLREYAVRPADERQRYVQDYFRLPRSELVSQYFAGRKRAIERPVTAATEAEVVAGLTAAQRDAVVAEDPALLVVAGPGTGKTHTIVRRVAHLIRARQIRGSEILVLAFGRAAARELRERLLEEVGRRARGVRVRTFHGLALELTGEDVRDGGTEAEERLAGVIGRAAGLLEGEGDDEDAEHRREEMLGSVRHVLVDEYQDLDADQYRLLTALVGLVRGKLPRGRARIERSVLVVGDDDQAIFGFRQASVEFLQRFEAEFGARRVCLVECFRSRPGIVASAVAFIAAVPGRLKTTPEEQLRTVRVDADDAPAAVRRFQYDRVDQLATHVAIVARKSLETGTKTLGILARDWASLDGVRGALETAGIAHHLSHRDHHRPLHRRHPADRIIQGLYKAGGVLDGSAHGHLREVLAKMGRDESDPTSRELLQLAADIDAELAPLSPAPQRGAEQADERTSPLRSAELADRLLLASREADRRAISEPVWLGTFHGAKGLEFDKVIVLPSPRDGRSDPSEERRLFYVAMTRARDELVLAQIDPSEWAAEVDAPSVDLRRHEGKLVGPRVAYLDATPRDVVIRSVKIGQAQARITYLREGEPLRVVDEGDRVVLLADAPEHAPAFVGELSERGVGRFRQLRARTPGALTARVHEVFVQLQRDKEGWVEKRTLVVLPTFVVRG